MNICQTCKRPLWDGGHGLNRDECQGEFDERCDLLAKLSLAVEIIERAESNKHSPWCNGVHEGGMCEGDYLVSNAVNHLRSALPKGAKSEES